MSTDPDWFAFLRARPEITEINFWRPSGTELPAIPGTPVFFRIRNTNEIRGCGIYTTTSRAPISVVWQTFGQANGVPDFHTFLMKIAKLRHEPPNRVGNIGCVVLSEPVYFSSGVPYRRMYGPMVSEDTGSVEGARLWTALRMHIADSPKQASTLVPPATGLGSPTLAIPRLGQGAFRFRVTSAYDRKCAVTGEKTLPALDAAHIRAFSVAPSHETSNGILLRSDVHNLFDQGYVSVRPDFRFVVSDAIREEYENGRDYYRFHETAIRLPKQSSDRPDPDALDWHYSTVFRK